MKSKVKAKLFSLEAFLNKDGNVEILYDAVEPEEFEKTMNVLSHFMVQSKIVIRMCSSEFYLT